jgi:peptidylamidoglycolate lyase
VKWSPEGQFLYSWGMFGEHAGGFWGVHQISVDQEGNVYVAEVNNGRVQKFRPRAGANPAYLLARPVYAAWS